MTGKARLSLMVSIGAVLFMLGLALSAPVLYDAFCRATGYGGTTQIATKAPDRVLDRTVTMRFDTNVSGAPLRFKPSVTLHDVRLGEHGLAFFEVTNTSTRPVSAIASYNVTPLKAGLYFNKLECFCFDEQVFLPGEPMQLPVVFFISPEMADESSMDDVRTITLSYTFFGVDDFNPETKSASVNQVVAGQ